MISFCIHFLSCSQTGVEYFQKTFPSYFQTSDGHSGQSISSKVSDIHIDYTRGIFNDNHFIFVIFILFDIKFGFPSVDSNMDFMDALQLLKNMYVTGNIFKDDAMKRIKNTFIQNLPRNFMDFLVKNQAKIKDIKEKDDYDFSTIIEKVAAEEFYYGKGVTLDVMGKGVDFYKKFTDLQPEYLKKIIPKISEFVKQQNPSFDIEQKIQQNYSSANMQKLANFLFQSFVFAPQANNLCTIEIKDGAINKAEENWNSSTDKLIENYNLFFTPTKDNNKKDGGQNSEDKNSSENGSQSSVDNNQQNAGITPKKLVIGGGVVAAVVAGFGYLALKNQSPKTIKTTAQKPNNQS